MNHQAADTTGRSVRPPSRHVDGSATPVTIEASSERRNSAALAISSGRPVGPAARTVGALANQHPPGPKPAVDFLIGPGEKPGALGVVGPGQTAITRIFSGASRTPGSDEAHDPELAHRVDGGLKAGPHEPGGGRGEERLRRPGADLGMAASVVISTVRRLRSTARFEGAQVDALDEAGPDGRRGSRRNRGP